MNKLPLRIEKMVRDYATLLRKDKKIKVDQILVFGSVARGQQRQDSDVDLAVVSSQFNINRLDHLLYLKKMARKVSNDIEPRPLSNEDLDDRYYHLAAAVRRDGVRVV